MDCCFTKIGLVDMNRLQLFLQMRKISHSWRGQLTPCGVLIIITSYRSIEHGQGHRRCPSFGSSVSLSRERVTNLIALAPCEGFNLKGFYEAISTMRNRIPCFFETIQCGFMILRICLQHHTGFMKADWFHYVPLIFIASLEIFLHTYTCRPDSCMRACRPIHTQIYNDIHIFFKKYIYIQYIL